MMSLFDSVWVIARRDFIALVFSRFFIIFLLAPLLLFGFSIFFSMATRAQDRTATQPVVAMIVDGPTADALTHTRDRLAANTSEQTFPTLRVVAPAENVAAQAQNLLADEKGNYSAVLSGSLERPVLTGPRGASDFVGRRMQLLVDESRRSAALDQARAAPAARQLERVVTEQAVGSLNASRRALAQGAQVLIFMITLMLATLLLSTLVEEKSNKIIEVLAASVPLDAIFLGKLVAMLGISLVGLALWAGMLGIGLTLFLQLMRDLVTLPQIDPAVGWPVFVVLMLLYYTANYMLLGALFLGIGAQASNIREIQTISMPVTMLQLMVLLLAITTVGSAGGLLYWTGYIFPFSSPMSMVAVAAQSPSLWPHALALAWQALWVVIIIRISSRMFQRTVLKSSAGGSLFSFRFRRKPPA
ncbi:MAG: type transport system permease protein [Sphingomonadales bacterium]|jgi:ABC-2 type transport system permease protein|nr:type transport system permease protein [Sphingomonadales bacterium]